MRTHSGKLVSNRYSVPPMRCRPLRNLAMASAAHAVSISREETAWLESRRALLLDKPMQVSTTAMSQRCRKFARPQVCQYAGIQMSSQQRAPQRIHVGKRPEREGNETILRQPSRIVTEDTTASAVMTFEETTFEVSGVPQKAMNPLRRVLCGDIVHYSYLWAA